MIEATITLDELKRAVALVEQAHAKGYTASVAVLALVSGGRGIADCVLVVDGLLLTDGGAHNYGRQYSTKNVADLTRSRVQRPKRARRPSGPPTACDRISAKVRAEAIEFTGCMAAWLASTAVPLEIGRTFSAKAVRFGSVAFWEATSKFIEEQAWAEAQAMLLDGWSP